MDPDMGERKGTNPFRDCQTSYSLKLAILSCRRPDSNLVFSPFSTQAALALVATGAEGAALEQVIHRVLATAFQGNLYNFSSGAAFVIVNDGLASGGPDIRFSSGVWVDESLSLNEAFNESVTSPTSPYKAEAKAGRFQTQADDVKCKVNSRIENTTTGIIQELLPSGSVNHSARLILENSLYFMGVWEDKFDASQTEESEFWLPGGNSVRVPFLTSKRGIFMDKYDGYIVLKLLYKKGEDERQFTMHIFVPDDLDGLLEIPKRVGPYFSGQRSYKIMGEFKIPKFKISFGFEASQVLKSLGWTLSSTSRGDLKQMVDPTEGDKLYVSSIYHKSVVEVKEEGTAAAAATAAVVVEVEEGTEAATVTAAVAVEVVKGTKVANSTAAVSEEDDGEETEAATVVSMEDDEEGTEGAAPTSAVSVEDEVGTESATLTSADSLEDDKEGTEAAAYTSDVSVDDDEKGIESATVTSSDSMEDDEKRTSDVVIVKADRPFAFVIREEVTGGVLFAGYMLNPLTTAVCNI